MSLKAAYPAFVLHRIKENERKGGNGVRRKNRIGLQLAGLLLFLVMLFGFLQLGGGKWVLAEVLPGQASGGAFSLQLPEVWQTEETETLSAAVIGSDDVEFISPKKKLLAEPIAPFSEVFEEVKKKWYIVESRTTLLAEDIPIKEALERDFSIQKSGKEPKVLIFHTHSHEGFADSDMSKGLSEGIWGVGERLKQILEETYGIAVVHDDGQYDMVNGKGQTTGAYERMEPPIRAILEKYPSIEVCIDLHRDGIPEGKRLVTEVDGKPCAQVMFFNGLCRLYKNDTAQPISGLSNPYLQENLAFSLQMKTAAENLFPGFARKNYIAAYRYSLHMLPRSTLIEVGAQNNTKAEAHNAMEPLAAVLAQVLLKES